jgi:hypothetical protein
MSIGAWIGFCIFAIVGIIFIVFSAIYSYENDSYTWVIVTLIVLVLGAGILLGGHWYYNNTADGVRAMKDQQSTLNNGLYREITITAEDGRQIFYYKGKCDIETNPGYILFEDEQGLRQMVYWGVTDTIIVSELEKE